MTAVESARGWVGTPYAHAGRVKGPGGCVDCVGVILGVAKETGTIPEGYKTPFYEELNDGSLIRVVFADYGAEIESSSMQPGDVVVMQYGRYPQHVGIVADCPFGLGGLSIIHAYSPAGKVIEAPIDQALLERVVEAWRIAWAK
jgi:cell wall-associated NlpC family hydrolase